MRSLGLARLQRYAGPVYARTYLCSGLVVRHRKVANCLASTGTLLQDGCLFDSWLAAVCSAYSNMNLYLVC